ncbi:lytic murein transglycosylase [Candidatus Deianiraea vastatrix]|uniref:Membrane-bound lytic murein transglycosylase n=1 Tax=Candidatus Deianiraea vastatrix TaxID=2163644 RepID=A0A5B8XF56_9RICK|nr:lytic murein transglycosylase [Candidatus Deianiraea vastatrix]QED23922.1 Putative membrane-bound lytic murein transglycosylase [Candidatus Deianiraea vastatrix]
MRSVLFIALFMLLIENASAYNYEFTNIPSCSVVSIDNERSKITSNLGVDFDESICKSAMVIPKSETAISVTKKNDIIELSSEEKKLIKKYKDKILKLAKDAGVSRKTRNAFYDSVEYKNNITKLSNAQPEKKTYLVDYMMNQLSAENIAILSKNINLRKNRDKEMFDNLEKIFAVERSIMTALWMHETKFGKIMGNTRVIDSLFTLAYTNEKKREFFETNLIQFLQIIDMGHGDIGSRGSWAGAFGQVQFMPQTFLKYAINYDDKDKIDLWNKEEDALASLANYLYNIKWKKDGGLITEVILPDEFDYCLAGYVENKVKTVEEWKKLGVKLGKSRFGAKYFHDQYKKAWLIIPDRTHIFQNGCKPRAFLAYENFGHILDWNRSMFFGVTIAALQHESEKIFKTVDVASKKNDDDDENE